MKKIAVMIGLVCLVPTFGYGEDNYIEVEVEASYEAGEDDSKNDAINKAKAKAQREAAEEIVGVYLQSFTEVEGYQAVKDSVSMFTQALLKSKMLEKNYECAPNCVASVKLRVKAKRNELRKFEEIVDRLRSIVLKDKLERMEASRNELIVVKSVERNYIGDALKPLRSALELYETVSARDIDGEQIKALGELFHVNASDIKSIRWGVSLAPSGHRLSGTSWYTVWHGSANTNETLRVSQAGEMMEKITWLLPEDRTIMEDGGV